MPWLSHSSSAAAGELRDKVISSPAVADELCDDEGMVIRRANMSQNIDNIGRVLYTNVFLLA